MRHFAHQIAHIAAGWELSWDLRHSFDGGEGEIFLDLLDGTARVNGEPRLLSIFMVVRSWVEAELARAGIGSTWLRLATVEVTYKATPGERGTRYDLVSVGRVDTDYGASTATVENYQFG